MKRNGKVLWGGFIVVIVTAAILFSWFFGKSYWSTGELSYTKLCTSPIGDCIEPVYNPPPPPQTPPIATSTPMSEWETFENTKYGYTVLVPKTAFIRDVTYVPDIHTASELAFSGEGGDFDIKVIDTVLWSRLNEEERSNVAEIRKKFLALELKSFAEAIRDWDINYMIPHILDKKGDLEEIKFSGRMAYKLSFGPTNHLMVAGGSLPYPHAYIITENFYGQKVVIDYFLNDASEKMVQSIRFTK